MIIATVEFLITWGLFYGVLILTGQCKGPAIILGWIPWVICQQMMAFGLGLCVAIGAVFFRDLKIIMEVILHLWFWLTPIVYPITILSNSMQRVLVNCNPLTPVYRAMQNLYLLGSFDVSVFNLFSCGFVN